MSDSKFTPGPWVIDDESAMINGNECIEYIAMLGDEINDFGNDWDDPCITEEVKANARLIAAAPDMYEALVYIEKILVEVGLDKGVWVDQIRAAISKAEGKS